ncbi:acyltransferase [soil metagenome]
MDLRAPERRREYIGVQALRAVAALGVVAYHGTQLWAQRLTSTSGASEWIAGATGVDVFFVISGFVMMLTSQRLQGLSGAKDFIVRRLIRIVPLYWLVTTIKLVGLMRAPSLATNAVPSWTEAVKSYFFIPYRHSDGIINVLVIAGWTLVFEIFFYLIFAGSIAAKQNRLRFLAIVIGGVACVGLFRSPHWPVVFYTMDPIVLEFLAGAWLANRINTRSRVFSQPMALGVCAGWIVYLAFFSGWGDERLRFLLAGLPAILVVMAVVSLEDELHHRIPRWLRKLGDASYSIYLVHGVVLPVIGVLMVREGLMNSGRAKPVAVLLSLILSSLAGVVVYQVCEHPLTEWLKAKFNGKNREHQVV